MPVDAIELRPRNTVAIFDAAVRLVTTSSGLWAVTLPGGAALIAAGVALAEAIERRRSLLLPVLGWSLAWVFRALSQGAACHFAEQQVLGTSEPNTWSSWRAALRRAPSLITTCGISLTVTTLALTLTGGIAFFFLGAQVVGYAVAMRGLGPPLKLFSTARSLLGPTRATASLMRITGLVPLALGINLHLAVSIGILLVTHLFGFDLTFAAQFASITNPVWLAVVVLSTFTCFEPLRAACATLLLIDGRVRQEGLDLVAAVEQLPTRRNAGLATALAALLLSPMYANAAPSPLRLRIERVARECHVSERLDREALDDVDSLDEQRRNATSRFVTRVERRAFEDEDCAAVFRDLRAGLTQLHATTKLGESPRAAQQSREKANAILAQPEFQAAPKEAEAAEPESGQPSWLQAQWQKFWRWLTQALKDLPPPPQEDRSSFNAMPAASTVAVLALGLVVAIAVWLVSRFKTRAAPSVGQSVVGAALETQADPMSALSRPALAWASLADQLAAAGEFREAIRHLYLALLARLHAEGHISYDASRSNWEYLREFKGAAVALDAFRELTRRFDFAWYGRLFVDSSSYAVFRELTGPLLERGPGQKESTRA